MEHVHQRSIVRALSFRERRRMGRGDRILSLAEGEIRKVASVSPGGMRMEAFFKASRD